MFRPPQKYRSVYTSLATLILLGSLATGAQTASADSTKGAALDFSSAAPHSICAEPKIAYSYSQPEGAVIPAATGAAPQSLASNRADCVTDGTFRVEHSSFNAPSLPASRAIGLVKISERQAAFRMRGLDLPFSADRGPATGLQLADFSTSSLPRSVAAAKENPHEPTSLLPPHPSDLDGSSAAMPPPAAFDFVATPREVSYTSPPGRKNRFDPQQANGNLRKGMRWLTHMITGEED